MLRLNFLSVLLLLLLLIFPSSESLDVNVILLPPRMTHPVEYLLQESSGCFSWSLIHDRLLALEPVYIYNSECSRSVRLRSLLTYRGRIETTVFATNIHTGSGIWYKVIVDNIFRIEISLVSVRLDIDSFTKLSVRAFDAEGNVFSSLVGVQFMWELRPVEAGGVHRLVHVPLSESPFSVCGIFSDVYVVKGISVGHEIVAVNLMEPQREHIAHSLLLTVMEHIWINPPADLYVMIGAVVPYSLGVKRQNTPQALALPSQYHRWFVTNSSIAQVDSLMGVTRALNLGTTAVTVKDTRVVGHSILVSIHVVMPDTLCLYMLPLTPYGDPVEGVSATPSTSRWYAIAGQQYAIYSKVFVGGHGAHEIYITERNVVKFQDNDSTYWVTLLMPDDMFARHGWQNSRILKATLEGMGILSASLAYHSGHPQTAKALKAMQGIMVCHQVNFDMGKVNGSCQIIHLPWIPGLYQELELRAMGGCAEIATEYNWSSSDETVASVSASGVVQGKKPGQAIIKVVSVYDLMNFDEAMLKVYIPSSMVTLRNVSVQAVLGLNDPMCHWWLRVNESVISTDMPSGEAHVMEGATEVLSEGLSLKRQSNDTVSKIELILVDPPTETLTNVPLSRSGYQFSLRFRDANSHTFETIDNSGGVQFDCWVDPSFVGHAKPWRNLDTGNSYCLFFPYSPEHLVQSNPNLKAMRPRISLSINASLRESEHTMVSGSALFIGGFSLIDMDKGLSQLNLTPEYNKSIITVVGNTDVEVHWQRKDMVLVSLIDTNNLGFGGRADYEVTVLRDEEFEDKITIALPATGQRVELAVHYEATPSRFWRNFPLYVASGYLFVMCIIACYCKLFLPGPQKINEEQPMNVQQLLNAAQQLPNAEQASNMQQPRNVVQPQNIEQQRNAEEYNLIRQRIHRIPAAYNRQTILIQSNVLQRFH